MERIKIETGVKTYEIVDANDNLLGIISFNPSDINFYNRAFKFQDSINNILIDIKSDKSEKSAEEFAKIFADTDEKIKNSLNELFNDDTLSDTIFKGQNCLNPIKGEPFIYNVLKAIMPILEKNMQSEMEKSKKRTEKYVGDIK